MAHPILTPSFNRVDERGTLTEILNRGPWSSILTGSMKAGAVMGHHYHKETVIFFFLTSGAASIRTVHVQTGARDAFRLEAGQGVELHIDESHAIEFEQPSTFLLLKSHPFDRDNPDTYAYPVD